MLRSPNRRVVGPGLWLLAWSFAAQSQEPVTFTPEQLRADLASIESALERTHPDVSHSVDPAVLARAFDDVRSKLDRPMTADEAWKVMSGLNPVMADGHLTVLFPGGIAAEIQRHLKSGGRLFPYAVHVTESAAIFVRSRVDGSATPLAGKRIDTIEGVPADDVAEKLLAHMNGDTPALRAELLSDRFAFWYWKFFGEHRSFRLRIGGVESVAEASGDTPSAFREKTFEQLFRFELLADNAALLTIDEFYWRDKPKFYEFTRAAFERMRDAGTRTLIIDIRANPGGDDDVWYEGIMPYIATKPYRNGSTYVLKIIEGRAKEGQKVGRCRARNAGNRVPAPARQSTALQGQGLCPDQSTHLLICGALQQCRAGQRLRHAGRRRRRRAQHAERRHSEHQIATHANDGRGPAIRADPRVRSWRLVATGRARRR